MSAPQARIAAIDAEIESLTSKIAELEAKRDDPYPVGTILQARASAGVYPAYLIKVARVNGRLEARSHTPRWATLYDDFSGSMYDTLDDAIEYTGHEFKEIYVP